MHYIHRVATSNNTTDAIIYLDAYTFQLKMRIFQKQIYLPECIKMLITALVIFRETCTTGFSRHKAINYY